MLYIEPQSKDAAFHFSAEEFCMRHFSPEESIWMLWRTDKCVMLGSNQVAAAEIDLSAAEKLGVQVVRRSSGGGTIFTDEGTVQYTVILPYKGRGDVRQIECDFVATPVIEALRHLGLPVGLEGRNDILLEGKKISGLAQFIKQNRLCSHGSLLYSTDLSVLAQVLRPDEEKISTKALRSVQGRVTTLASYLTKPLSVDEFIGKMKGELFRGQAFHEYVFSDEDLAVIEQIRLAKYANLEWTFGKAPRFSYHGQKRFPMGKVEVFLEVQKGIIVACKLQGDFLGLIPLRGLEEELEGKLYRHDIIVRVLEQVDLRLYLGNISKEELLTCLFNI